MPATCERDLLHNPADPLVAPPSLGAMSQTNGNPVPPDEATIATSPAPRAQLRASGIRAGSPDIRTKSGPPSNGKDLKGTSVPRPSPDEAFRLARIAAREQWLDRREQDLLSTRRELDTSRQELHAYRAALDSQQAELNRQRDLLARKLRSRSSKLKRLRDAFRARHAANQAAIAQQLADLNLQREQIVKRELEIQQGADALEREQLQLQLRHEELQEQERTVEQERADLLAQSSGLATLGQELEQAQETLQAEREQLLQQREHLAQASAMLEQQFAQRHQSLEAEFESRHEALEAQVQQQFHALEARSRALTDAEQASRQEASRLDAWRSDLQQQVDAAQQRAAELDRTAQGLLLEQAALSDAQRSLEAREHALEQRHKDLEAALEDLASARDELYHKQKQVEGLEAEARQAAASLEVERLEATQLREQLQQQLSEAVQERQEFDRHAREARLAISSEARRLVRTPRAATAAGPVRWAARAIGIGLTAGAACAAIAWSLTLPKPEAHAVVRLKNISRPFPVAAAEHAAALGDPALADQWLSDPADAQQWSGLLKQDRVRVLADPVESAIRIALRDYEPGQPALLQKVAENYVQRQQSTERLRDLPAAFTLLDQVAHRIRTQQTRLSSETARVAAELSADDSPLAWEAARSRLDDLLNQQQSAVSSLADARDRLSSVLAITHPRGEVSQDALNAALQQDEIYQQDAAELEFVVRGYRDELLRAIDAAPEVIARYRTVLQPLRDELRQQLALRPSVQVARALEASMGDVDACAESTDRYFRAWTDAAARLPAEASAVVAARLIATFDEASEAARRLTRAGETLSQSLNRRWEALEALGDGGTREVVTLNTVRSAINSFSTAVLVLRRDLSSLDREQNFELDALDRQVRSLQQRRDERPQAVLARLQAEADQQAAEEHARQVDALRSRVEELAARREMLAVAVVEQISDVRLAHERALQRRSTELEQSIRTAHADRIAQELRQIEADLALARADASTNQADQLIAGSLQTEETQDARRPVWVASAGASGFSVAWLACAALMARVPRRAGPRQALLARLAREDAAEPEGSSYEDTAAAAAHEEPRRRGDAPAGDRDPARPVSQE